MKIAITADGNQLEATADAPAEAICPYCKGVVTLRGRKLMGSYKKTYFWRHRDGSNAQCPKHTRRGRWR